MCPFWLYAGHYISKRVKGEMAAEKEISFDKPGYDGRLNYHAILKGYMIAIATTSFNDDYRSWAKLLRDMYGFVAPYIKSDDAELSKNEIELCENSIEVGNSCVVRSNQNIVLNIVRKKLREATDNLYSRAKHLLLPVKSEGEQTFDENNFMGESDL